jgi:hypothetical protein
MSADADTPKEAAKLAHAAMSRLFQKQLPVWLRVVPFAQARSPSALPYYFEFPPTEGDVAAKEET